MTIPRRIPRMVISALLGSIAVVAAPDLSAQAAPPNGTLAIVTQVPSATAAVFSFAMSPASTGGSTNAAVTGAGSVSLPYGATNALSITQTVPAGFGPVSITCVVNGGTTGTVSGSRVTGVKIVSNKTTTCTFSQSLLPVTASASLAFSPAYLSHLGSDTTQTWSVRNPNAFPTTLTAVTDSRLGPLSSSTCHPGTTLAAGASCGGSFTIFLAKPAGGTETSSVTATLASAAGTSATSSVSKTLTFLTQSAQLSVVKGASPSVLPAAGGWTTVTVMAMNQGSEPLTLGAFTDTAWGPLDNAPTCRTGTVLFPGESCSFSTQWWLSGSPGTSRTSTVWNIAVTDSGTSVLGEGSATISFS